MTIVAVETYAPFDLISDAAQLGLTTTTVSSPLGTCVARHPLRRTSTRATLFLHGAAGSWTTWTPLLQAAKDDHIDLGDIVVFDLPGWGDAELAVGSVDDPVLAICSLVKDMAEELGYTEWDLVGHSLGGFIALHMASIWPQAVLSVGMVSGTTFSIIHSVEHPIRHFGELPGFTMLWRVMQFLAASGRPVPPSFAASAPSGCFARRRSPSSATGGRFPDRRAARSPSRSVRDPSPRQRA